MEPLKKALGIGITTEKEAAAAEASVKEKIKKIGRDVLPGLSWTGIQTGISFVPFVGTGISTAIDQTLKVIGNKKAKADLLLEVKYNILLIHSCNKLTNYIKNRDFEQYICSHNEFLNFIQLQKNLFNKLEELRINDTLNERINADIESLYMSMYKRREDQDEIVYNENRSARKKKFDQVLEEHQIKPEEILQKTLSSTTTELELTQIQHYYLKEALEIVDFLLNDEGNNVSKAFSIDSYIEKFGLRKPAKGDRGEQLAEALQDYDQIGEISEALGVNEYSDDKLLLYTKPFIIHYFNSLFDYIESSESRSSRFKKVSEKISKYLTIISVWNELNMNSFIQSLKHTKEIKQQLDTLQNYITRLTYVSPPEGVRTRASEASKKTKEFLNKTQLESSYVEYRDELNKLATFLNSYYQDLLFQVQQLDKMDAEQRDSMLCPDVDLQFFLPKTRLGI